ncbi:MAG TPA: hypothetical protein P5563_00710, partial [Saprospiraceae bacterium]|nr:hypothetical protein [Saprospiraceae bacterium]
MNLELLKHTTLQIPQEPGTWNLEQSRTCAGCRNQKQKSPVRNDRALWCGAELNPDDPAYQ